MHTAISHYDFICLNWVPRFTVMPSTVRESDWVQAQPQAGRALCRNIHYWWPVTWKRVVKQLSYILWIWWESERFTASRSLITWGVTSLKLHLNFSGDEMNISTKFGRNRIIWMGKNREHTHRHTHISQIYIRYQDL